MSEFGLVLVWCAIQVTILCFLAGLVYLLVRQFGPSAGSLAALASLVLVIGLSLLAFSPWPSWSHLSRAQNASGVELADSLLTRASIPSRGEALDSTKTRSFRSDEAAGSISPTIVEFFTAFTNGLQTASATSDRAATVWHWPTTVALIFMLGVGLGLIRLLAGFFSVEAYRRKSQPVREKSILAMVKRLRAASNCNKSIELRDSATLATAATVGWRRPLILLPVGWRDWNEQERIAVLAHEIAHIRRNDFLAWICAQVGLALHFYHPLVHWLAGRLRLEQELAADAMAASLSGGQRLYLTTLAEMALRQSDQPLSWPARTFLPNRRTFLRRIEMLRDVKTLSSPISASRRVAIVSVLLLVGLAAAGFRGAGLTASKEAEAAQRSVERQRQSTGRSFSLAYVPRDAVVVGAIRPAALLSQPAMKPIADMLTQQGGLAKQFGIPIERIESMTFAFVSQSNRPAPALAGVIVRTKTADDALEFGKAFAPDAVKKSYSDEEYYESQSHRGRFYYLADKQTVITSDDVRFLRRIIVAGQPGASQTKWASIWQEMADNDAAILYNLGSLKAMIDAELKSAPGSAPFAPLWQSAKTASMGMKIDQQLGLRGVAKCETVKDAQKVHETLSAAVTLARNAVSQLRQSASARPDRDGALGLKTADLADGLLDGLEITQEGADVILQASASSKDTAEAVATLLPGVRAARDAARRSQSTNNMKQLALSFHNYHEVHGHFPPAVVIGPDGKTPHSWRVEILPYLEQTELYDQYRVNEEWDSPHNKALLQKMPAVFRSPKDDPKSTNSAYFALTGNGTVFSDKAGTRMREIADGSSRTILLVEAKRQIPWTKPEDIPYDPQAKIPQLGGFHQGLFLAILCDGSARRIAHSTDEKILHLLITMDDGQQIGEF